MSTRINNTIALILANGINLLINFITIPFLARKLSFQDFGTYSQLILIGSLVQIGFCLGLPTILNAVAAQNKDEEKKVFFNANFFIFFSAVISSILLLILILLKIELFNNPKILEGLKIYIPTIFFLIVTPHVTLQLVFYNKTKDLAFIMVITNIIRIGLFVIAIYYFKSLNAILLSLLFTFALQFFLYNYSLRSQIGFYRMQFDSELSKKILKIAFPLLLTGVFGYGMIYIDGILIASLMPIKDFAIYRNGAIEIPFISTIYVSVSSILMPDMVRLYKSKNISEILYLKRKAANNVAALVYPIVVFFIINGNFFIKSYLSEKYVESAIVFSLYNIASLFRITDYHDIFSVTGKTNKILSYYLIGVVVNLILNVWLIKSFGLLGGVAAFLISLIVLLASISVGSAKYLQVKVNSLFDFKSLSMMLGISVILAFFVFILHQFTTSTPIFIISGGVYFLVTYKLFFRMEIIQRDYFERMLQKVPLGNYIFKLIA